VKDVIYKLNITLYLLCQYFVIVDALTHAFVCLMPDLLRLSVIYIVNI